MRFKARISKENLLMLHALTSSLEKLGSRAAIHLSPTSVKISVIFENIDAPRSYVEIPSVSLFHEYRIESQSENSILFEIGLDLLSWALASGKTSDICQLKLVKRDAKPCLCFEAHASQGVAAVGILHDIPIKVLPASDIAYFAPPDVPPPDTALQLPRGRLLRTIIEKMVKFGKSMQITSSQVGQLTFGISQSTINIKTFVNNLVPIFTEGMDRTRDANNTASVHIDIRKLSCVLALHHLPWDSAVIYMAHNATLFLELPLLGTGSIGFYVPILLLDQQDECQ
jgi:HUS1 checkpoint protein